MGSQRVRHDLATEQLHSQDMDGVCVCVCVCVCREREITTKERLALVTHLHQSHLEMGLEGRKMYQPCIVKREHPLLLSSQYTAPPPHPIKEFLGGLS